MVVEQWEFVGLLDPARESYKVAWIGEPGLLIRYILEIVEFEVEKVEQHKPDLFVKDRLVILELWFGKFVQRVDKLGLVSQNLLCIDPTIL